MISFRDDGKLAVWCQMPSERVKCAAKETSEYTFSGFLTLSCSLGMICAGSGLENKNDLKHTQEHVVKIKG
jgi:hypothetical protein